MAVAVVNGLEVVEVGEREGDRASEPLRTHELTRERLLAVAPVGEAGQLVDEGLARDDPVQARVLERDRGVRHERRCCAPLVEREAAARKRERAEALPPGGERQLEALAAGGQRP